MNRLVIHLVVRLITVITITVILIMPAAGFAAPPGDGPPAETPPAGEAAPSETPPAGDGPIPLQDLHYTDRRFIPLYESSVASKNRLLDGERLEAYEPPNLYRYTLKHGEDIWTIVARTSLNIDTIATLNQVDFIGMLREDAVVYLPDTLGVFHRPGDAALQDARQELAFRYGVPEQDVLALSDPLADLLLFVPEVTLSFLARTYLTGVVFHTPLMGIETSSFGTRVDPFINDEAFHGGVDLAAQLGKKVHAARWGAVLFAGEWEGYGNTVVLRHELGYHTLYAHLDELLVETGADVMTGQVVGTVGETGRTTGPHLHFEIRRFNELLDPGNIPFFLPGHRPNAP